MFEKLETWININSDQVQIKICQWEIATFHFVAWLVEEVSRTKTSTRRLIELFAACISAALDPEE